MIDLNSNTRKNLFKEAEDLFCPFQKNNLNQSKLQSLKQSAKETLFFIQKNKKRKAFVEGFNKQVDQVSSVKENFADFIDDPRIIIKTYAKKMKQLNSLNLINKLIKNHYKNNKQDTTEIKIKNSIYETQKIINAYINAIEDKKRNNQKTKLIENCLNFSKEINENEIDKSSDRINALVVEQIQSSQEEVKNFSSILIDKDEKTVETNPPIESSEKTEASQVLQPSLMKENISDTPKDSQVLQTNLIKENNRDTSKNSQPLQHNQLEEKSEPNKSLEILPKSLEADSNNLLGRVKEMIGIKDITTGINAIRNGNYGSGIWNLSLGFIRMIALAALAACVAQNQILSRQKIDLESTNKALLNQIIDIENENQNLIGLRARDKALWEQKNGLENENQVLLKQKTGLQNENQDLREQKTGLQNENQVLLKQKTGLQNENQVMLKLKADLENENQKLEKENSFLKKESEKSFIQKWFESFSKGNEENTVPLAHPSQIHSRLKHRKITLITAYDGGIKDYAQHVISNQKSYANLHKYEYIEYFGNLAEGQGYSRAPYWSKIIALNDQLQNGEEGEWIAWIDASVLFTNTQKDFDQIIEKYGSDKDIILTNDPQVPINNAVFLIKNTPWTKKWIEKVWSRSDLAKGGEGNCWSWRQPFCHYEQQAMTELWERDPEVRSHTTVIPNKEMNAFYRYSHYDPHRRMHQNYDGDLENTKWAPGDFICKVTGMDKDRRLKIIQHVANNCIDRNCETIRF